MSLTPNLRALAENSGVDGSPWSNSVLATDAQRDASGHVSRVPSTAAPVQASLSLVVRLANDAEALATGMQTGMGSEGSEGLDGFYASATSDQACGEFNEAAIRRLFGDALFEDTSIKIEPLTTTSEWWESVSEDSEHDEQYLGPWRTLLEWFAAQPEFVETAFARIDRLENEEYGTDGGCVFPRLLLGRCADGGVAGLLGVVVYT